ncbi:ribosome maturation factor RimM [Roseospira visakhapatnamensis]|uniref:Ribosome maturation factor RimM n=1 Tax=Roseospira visakhapatnamensis TaxID=390880 RepID=A0A7W6RCE5_9PROT|nr:ribosome maturation factor RimM [Roseospira visakhapatnamensis]MBB4265576.1 16S rRNA processing protein RimM [Roseospira visakhapatnamensis]
MTDPGMNDRGMGDRVRLGVVVGVHGVRGLVRIKSFTGQPEDIAAYGPVSDEAGARTWRLTVTGQAKGVLLARLEGVDDRTAAEALKGTPLCVPRSALPPMDDEETFYHADLIGLTVRRADDTVFGRVTAVHDFGAGDMLEVRPHEAGPPDEPPDEARTVAQTVMVPFTRTVVPRVDLPGACLWVADLPGLLDPSPPGGEPLPPEAGEGATDD